ncbi:F-box associated interaction domain [Arabidopsis thaliana x Arabidopsis arenosa]|uniref:F-box associated interaction domain n=1 Tax=Arabidopsis thaliana x Arabidopsis arenosa TaxID=1240361 RepID=A0A8T2BEH8_9BRAS|nr:F-box associated interaction domain [Arabidopsis thaliana x Arabidopsis arenosa]
MGYDGSKPEKSYKIIGIMKTHSRGEKITTSAVFEFATNAWKVTHRTGFHRDITSTHSSPVSLNGNLYWTAYSYTAETGQYVIERLDFSKEIIKTFCILPSKWKESFSHAQVLAIYKGDRFSVLEQCKRTSEIEIWVTKNKIGNGDDGDDVVWIKFMTFSIPDFPLVLSYKSYLVDNNIYGKSFVLCCLTKKPKQGWVYIVRGDMCKQIKIDKVLCKFQSSVYVPSLINIF